MSLLAGHRTVGRMETDRMLRLAHEGLLALRLRAAQVAKAALGHMQDAQVLHAVLLGRISLN